MALLLPPYPEGTLKILSPLTLLVPLRALASAVRALLAGALRVMVLLVAAPIAIASGQGDLPPLSGATLWLNSPALTRQALRGKVVLVDFWTYSCINCLRSLPYVKSWYQRYKDYGLIVIGVHAPEFDFEKLPGNVRLAVANLGIAYPVALDNNLAIWRAFNNQYWPAHYFVDAMGHIRGHHYGEGDYAETEQALRQLLVEAGHHNLPPVGPALASMSGVEQAADAAHMQSPETYLGFQRAQNFASPGGVVADRAKTYSTPPRLGLNQWALDGSWFVRDDAGVLEAAPGAISFRFNARDLHLVMGPGADGRPIRFRVDLDGVAPGADHGVDIAPDGSGIVREQRLYQLIRQSRSVQEHTFTIRFLDSGVQAYSFTFG
jgi:thiol-disulfide isomerase/thioredoxin